MSQATNATHTAVDVPEAPPRPGAHYSQAIKVPVGERTLVFITGQTSRDPVNREILHKGDAEGQARVVLQRIDAILKASGGSRESVVHLRIFYKDVTYVEMVVGLRDEFFASQPYPAVTGCICDLTYPELLIEMDAVAVI